MSATISNKKLNFVIFGAGHDYTLADSGRGERVFFSHPYVPLNSRVYAGQFYFLVPVYDDEDETVEPVMTDVVKYDIAHCTFTPDINDIFDTEGEVQVKVHYRREYIYPESTILVEKELTQTIEVVNHGTVVEQAVYGASTGHYYRRDIYSDGYCFIRPMSLYEFPDYYCLSSWQGKTINKVSSIPWRAKGLGDGIYGFGCSGNVDISELQYADISNVTYMYDVFGHCYAPDWTAISKWDTSSLREIHFFSQYSGLTDFSVFSDWHTANLVNIRNIFSNALMAKLDGLENWDVSNVMDMQNLFSGCQNLTDIKALADWDTSKVTNMGYLFGGDSELVSLEGLENWDVSKVTNLISAFSNCYKLQSVVPLSNWNPKPTTIYRLFVNCYALQSLDGLENFDTSNCTIFSEAFFSCNRLLDIDALGSWDISKGITFDSMFAWDYWISDISMINNWDFGMATNLNSMFLYVSALLSLDGITLDIQNVNGTGAMFHTFTFGYMEGVGDVVERNYFYYDYDGHAYSIIGSSITPYTKDASGADNWLVIGSGRDIFNDKWTNIPSWN